jgi:hypothetical protein
MAYVQLSVYGVLCVEYRAKTYVKSTVAIICHYMLCFGRDPKIRV